MSEIQESTSVGVGATWPGGGVSGEEVPSDARARARPSRIAVAWAAVARILLVAAVPFTVSRALVALGALIGQYGLTPAMSVSWSVPESWLQPLFKWDAAYYLSIAKYGYQIPLFSAFFPLYSEIARDLAPILGGLDMSMIMVSNASLLLSMVLLYVLARGLVGEGPAHLSTWLLALYPWSLFLSAPYAESLFVLLSLAVFLALRSRRWIPAGVAAMMAAATRGQGFVLTAAFAGELAWRSRPLNAGFMRRLRRRDLFLAVAAAALCLSGVGAIAVAQWHIYGNPKEFLDIQRDWVAAGRPTLQPFRVFLHFVRHPDPHNTEWPGAPLLALWLLASLWMLWRLPWGYGLYSLGMLALAGWHGLHIHLFFSVPRHLMVTFPVFIALAAWIQRPWLKLIVPPLLVVMAVGLVSYTAFYSSWRFVG